MCGIAGFTRFKRDLGNEPLLRAMGEAIVHRGPDAHGTFLDDSVGLCHRRLSIIDLSESGNQPMRSSCGRYYIVFNGEIYNFLSLREQAKKEGYRFRSKSDTEVILYLYQRYGEKFVDYLNGMFAIALWDTQSEKLVLVRDRLGKKPLYYHRQGDELIFASEIKAILQVPGLTIKPRDDAIYDFFNYQYVPDPKTIYQDIFKLPAGHMIVASASGIDIKQYWDVSFETKEATESTAIEELQSLLSDSVRSRMISDVPLGAFLSGGIDSSVVVALMAQNTAEPVTTCSIGFDSKRFDEVEFAKIVADKYETAHHEYTVRDTVAENLLDIARYFDEPFADPSFVPTYFVSGLARKNVTVALAGDGGDECFAGYSKYRLDNIENTIRQRIPSALRRRVIPALRRPIAGVGAGPLKRAASLLETLSREPDFGFYLSNSFFRQDLWEQLALPEFRQRLSDYHPFEVTREHYHAADSDEHLNRILYTDLKTYLAGDILVKVDRMSMAHSLETRAPLLDYRIVEFAAALDPALKLHGAEKKYILKKAYENELPHDILYRKKMGFSVPLANWLREEIRDIFESHVLRPSSGLSNYFDMTQVQLLWQRHLSGEVDNSQELWSMLVFEMWWGHYMEPSLRSAA